MYVERCRTGVFVAEFKLRVNTAGLSRLSTGKYNGILARKVRDAVEKLRSENGLKVVGIERVDVTVRETELRVQVWFYGDQEFDKVYKGTQDIRNKLAVATRAAAEAAERFIVDVENIFKTKEEASR